jgi:hypothetical protein
MCIIASAMEEGLPYSYMISSAFEILYLHMYGTHIFLPKIHGEEWGAAHIRNNFTLHFKKIIFIIHNFYS